VTKLGSSFNKCPKLWYQTDGKDFAQHLKDWQWLQRHQILPDEGGLMDQDAGFVSAVEFFESEFEKIKEALANGTDRK
tara:strand:+ start:2411 stop:2644 length:234 start_codon:yes stop_codon:yes gene_type:complete